MSGNEVTPARLIITLTIAGILSGIALVGVYLATKPVIEKNQAEALQRALFEVLPGMARSRPMVLDGNGLKALPENEKPPRGEVVYAGYGDDGRFIGFGIPAEGPGFQDTIGLIFGYVPARKMIVGLEVLESRETPGLGDKITKDPDFKKNFAALAVEPPPVAVKHGTKSKPNEVDAISGATISSNSVAAIIRSALARWRPVLDSFQPTE